MAYDWSFVDKYRSEPSSTSGSEYSSETSEGALDSFIRGGKESFQQIPQLGWGLVAGAAATGESAFGEGGLLTGIKNYAVEKYSDWSEEIASNAQPTDSLDFSYERAKKGDVGALFNWASHGLGYVGGQAITLLTGAGIGEKAAETALRAS